ILDIGTGSGAIPVALARHHETAVLTATDVSAPALEVARRNAAKHGVSGRVRLLHGDLFAPVPPGGAINLIRSNPPYIPTTDIAGLAAGVRDYEPHLALDGGPDGFALFDRLIAAAPAYLKSGGYLIVEIGSAQEAPARAKIEAHGGYDLDTT